ncbi:hypothetical protein ACWFRJ_42540 [Streptomyces sp. NPDC055239]
MSEYLNDLSIRSLLQGIVDDPAVQALPAYSWFSCELDRIDEVFRELLADGPLIRPEEQRWWRRSLPPAGGQDFVDDVRDRYHVELRIVD